VDLFVIQGFSFLGFLKNLGFVGYALLFLHSRYDDLRILLPKETTAKYYNIVSFLLKI